MPWLSSIPPLCIYGTEASAHPHKAFPRNSLPHHIHSPSIHSLLRRLQPYFDQIERMSHYYRENTTHAASCEVPQAGNGLLCCNSNILFELFC